MLHEKWKQQYKHKNGGGYGSDFVGDSLKAVCFFIPVIFIRSLPVIGNIVICLAIAMRELKLFMKCLILENLLFLLSQTIRDEN